jgi:hypothetical protein
MRLHDGSILADACSASSLGLGVDLDSSPRDDQLGGVTNTEPPDLNNVRLLLVNCDEKLITGRGTEHCDDSFQQCQLLLLFFLPASDLHFEHLILPST